MNKDKHDRQIWLRLAKFKAGGASLGEKAFGVFEQLSSEHPDWSVSPNGQEEFFVWMSVGEGTLEQIESPGDLEPLVQWLIDNPTSNTFKDDDWRDRCRNDLKLATEALKALDRRGKWIPDRLQDALNVWASEEKLLKESWTELGPYLTSLSLERVADVVRSLSYWLQALAVVLKEENSQFFGLIEMILDQPPIESGMKDDPLSVAINHPVGHVSGALLRWWDWYRGDVKRGLHGEVRRLMTRICETDVQKYCHGRVVLARSIAALFSEDKEWSVKYLIPLFDWTKSEDEAVGAWSAFLNSPRGNPDLFFYLKEPFLRIREHLPKFDEDYREQFIRFLTVIGLSRSDTLSVEEMRGIFKELDLQQLGIAAQTMSNAMEGASDKAALYWSEVWYPFFREVWPKTREAISQETAGRFAEVCVDAGEAFPLAVAALKDFLVPIQWPDWIVEKLVETGRHKADPAEALELVSRIAGESIQTSVSVLRRLLDDVGAEKPGLRSSAAYQKLERFPGA